MKLRSVQMLRAVAALLVVLHHAAPLPLGAAGVDLFFVISGFIIASIAPGQPPMRFLARRAARIYPLYWLCQAPAFAQAALTSQLSAKLAFASLTLVSLGQVSRPVLGVGWTLMFEVFFYAGAAASLALCDARPGLLAVVLFLLANMVTGNALFGFLGHPLILEFLVGALVALLPRRTTWACAALFLALGLLWLGGNGQGMPWPWNYAGSAWQLYRAAAWGVPAALTLYCAVTLEPWFAHRCWSPAVSLGDASYALYLTHGAIILLGFWWLPTVLLSVGLAFIVHWSIERPLVAAAMARIGAVDDCAAPGAAARALKVGT